MEEWLASYGEEAALRMLAGSLGKAPVYLRANTLRITPEALCERLAAEGAEAVPAAPPGGCVAVRGRLAVETLPAFAEGLFHVQDRASQLCAEALGALPGERVLDACAAPGGKTFTIAERMENHGEVVARDLHQKRADLVQRARAAWACRSSPPRRGRGVYDPALGEFDRVLCDVPCSGFGVIRRKPEIKYKPPESIQNLPEIQYKILQTSSQYLRSGGRLVYSTCTLLPAENERVVERFLAENGGFGLISQETHTGEREDTDGFFTACLERR